jgi:hypothetical protein
MEKLKGWRTIIFAFILAGLGGLTEADWLTVIPAEYIGVSMIVVGAVTAILRMMTNTPVGTKQ